MGLLRRVTFTLGCLLLGVVLSGCAARPLLGDVVSSSTRFEPTASGEPLTISYEIGQTATVDIYLLDSNDTRYVLRSQEPRVATDDAYTLRFDGTVPTSDGVLQRRLLASGSYTLVIEATAEDGTNQRRDLALDIVGSDVPLPDVANLLVSPQTISPNADAIDDVAEFTYRLPVSATVDIDILAPNGERIPVVTRAEEGPFEQSHVWNGKRPNGSLLANGIYTYTVRAEDAYGNLVLREGTLQLADVGQPEARIVYASIAPEKVMLGETLTVTMRIRNTGDVPIRTYGPPSGHRYTTDEVFSSIEDGQYTAQAGGFWRIGLDWDANSGGGPKRYPFRWALSSRPPEQWKVPFVEDWLLPGEEVEVVGEVTLLQRETRMGFYVGLIQDGVGFFQDRTARTIVEVGFGWICA
ncbi:hypothetical protein HC891_27740 [Candidatus Gracilibacteria bacterium]|nr:hypothetical protein [Candidatus Gracilibacteria bacterium]